MGNSATNTVRSNGHKVRINSKSMPGYILVDSVIDTFYLIDKQNKQIMKMSIDDIGDGALGKKMNVSLKPRGKGDKIAGYSTGRFDLIADGGIEKRSGQAAPCNQLDVQL